MTLRDTLLSFRKMGGGIDGATLVWIGDNVVSMGTS